MIPKVKLLNANPDGSHSFVFDARPDMDQCVKRENGGRVWVLTGRTDEDGVPTAGWMFD